MTSNLFLLVIPRIIIVMILYPFATHPLCLFVLEHQYKELSWGCSFPFSTISIIVLFAVSKLMFYSKFFVEHLGFNFSLNYSSFQHSLHLLGLVVTSGAKGDGKLLLWNALRGELASDLNSNLR